MKLHADRFDVQTISGYGPGWVSIDKEEFTRSVIVGSRGERIEWNCDRFEDLTPEHFAQLADLGPEVVIFGSGQKNRFPPPAWLAPLMEKRLGVESMNTQAACRTYNILAGEGRHVIAALILEKQQ
ncbi:Mth938-like domain-containing protein [Diaphorobacter caeni]|uniref:Mth938-like domain-containing protein n=1 Tax=Diaphorobacter caeni TaxID=2784387 RepID=UPI00188DD6F5|nr:Mth938-like domain-containing protein [Diaphorobacter caeni]MBF5003319.1 Mth938-like domain-containing protein [Diaphorobacter caeni]